MSMYALDKETRSHKVGARAIIALIGGIIGLIPVGTAYTFGNFAPYIVSYIRNRTDDTSLRNVDSLWVGTVGTVFQCVGSVFGGISDRYLGSRVSIAIGGLIFSGSTILTCFFIKLSFIAVVISYGLMQSLGAKIVYGLSVQVAIKWFPSRSSLAAGLVLTGYGAGALVFNQVITVFINPDNLSPDLVTDTGEKYFTDPELLDRVPTCFLMLGGTFIGMQIIGVFALSVPPEPIEPVKTITVERNGHMTPANEERLFSISATVDDSTGKLADGDSNALTKDSTRQDGEAANKGITKENSKIVFETIHSGSNSIHSEATKIGDKITHYTDENFNDTVKVNIENSGVVKPNDGVENIAPASEVSSASRTNVKQVVLRTLKTRSLYVVCLTIFCFSWALRFIAGLYKAYGQMFIDDDAFLALAGTLSSIFNSLCRPCWGLVMDKFGYRFAIRWISVGFAAVCGTLFLTEHMHKAAFMVWICALFAMYSGVWAVTPAALARLYGVENTAINYGFIFLTAAISNIANLVIGTTLKDVIGYHGMFFVCAGLGILPFLLTFLFNGIDADGKRV